jgi:hypothetical protein
MRTDAYTKAVLTVIAACLVWLCLNTLTPTAAAQVDPNRPLNVVIVDDRGQPLNTAQGLRVSLGTPVVISQTAPVPVALTAIERRGTWQPIQVDVLRPPPTLMPTP